MSKSINEEKLIAALYANFRGKKKKINDWMSIAETVDKLSKFYGSHKKLASHLGVSSELIRETLKLLELPNEVQQIVREGKLKHEVAWRIASIKGKENQIKIANKVIGMKTHDARDLVRLFRINQDIDIERYSSQLKKSKKGIEKINLVIVPMKQIDYFYLKKEASQNKITPSKLISDIIIPKWLKREDK